VSVRAYIYTFDSPEANRKRKKERKKERRKERRKKERKEIL